MTENEKFDNMPKIKPATDAQWKDYFRNQTHKLTQEVIYLKSKLEEAEKECQRYASNQCGDRNHIGLELVMCNLPGGRLPNPELGQNAAMIAAQLGQLENRLSVCVAGLKKISSGGLSNHEMLEEARQAITTQDMKENHEIR